MKRAWWIGLLMLCLIGFQRAQADNDDSTPETPQRQAAMFFRTGQYPEAIASYREIAKSNPTNLDAQKDLMWVLWNTGEFEKAGEEADRILKDHPDDVEARAISNRSFLTAHREKILELRKQAAAAIRAGNYAAAEALFKELLTLDPQNYRLLKDAMWTNASAGNTAESVALARRVLVLRPDDSDAIELLNRATGSTMDPTLSVAVRIRIANARAEAGQTEQAIEWLEKLAAENPGNADVLRYLVAICHRTGRTTEGLKYAQKWTELAPKDSRSWFWLGVMQMDNQQMDAAQVSYEHSLSLDPDQPRAELAIGRFYVADREFALAITHLEKARKANPSLSEVYPLLGKAYFWTQNYDTSALYWKEAVKRYPNQDDYKFNLAEALYYGGHETEAEDIMRPISSDDKYPAIALFLEDDALTHHDPTTAAHLLEDHLKNAKPTDENLVLKLGGIYNRQGEQDKTIQLADHFLTVSPNNTPILLMKGNAYYAKRDYKDAAEMDEKVLQINPNDVEALQTLAACERSLGHPTEAHRILLRLLAIDPTYPYFILLEARERYDDGSKAPARKTIETWENENSTSTAVPILLYHALTPFKDDPILAYPYHMTTSTFEGQMQSLVTAGYTPVTTDQVSAWSHENAPLPAHPVLISFDDARSDSVLYGDPVLQKLGLHATMFAALVNVDGLRPPGFMPWSRLVEIQKSGRWDIQSHGDYAHIHIPVNVEGAEGLFLVNRKWLIPENRLETLDEWRARIAGDYQTSHDKILKNIGTAPGAYAFPEGIYGQQGSVNTPEALETNLTLVATTYTTAYTQDSSGVNVHSRDPYRLDRLEPPNTWSGAQLLAHLHDSDPRVAMLDQLIDWAIWEGRLPQAHALLNQMAAYQISDGLRLSKEAEIALGEGDYKKGHALALQAFALGDYPDLKESLEEVHLEEGWSWDSALSYEQDSSARRSLLFENALRSERYGSWRFGLRQQWGWFHDNGAGTIYDNGLGLEAQYYLGLNQRFTAVVMDQLLSSPADNTITASGEWDARWQNRVNTALIAGERFVPTASAMADHIDEHYLRGNLWWDINDLWRAGTDNWVSGLTDGNSRFTTQEEVSRLIWDPIHLRAVYQFTYDNMSFQAPQYYSPQDLIVNSLGPEFWIQVTPTMKWWLRYLPGYATEDNQSGQFVQSVNTRLEMEWHANSLVPEYFYYESPGYHEHIFRIEFIHHF